MTWQGMTTEERRQAIRDAIAGNDWISAAHFAASQGVTRHVIIGLAFRGNISLPKHKGGPHADGKPVRSRTRTVQPNRYVQRRPPHAPPIPKAPKPPVNLDVAVPTVALATSDTIRDCQCHFPMWGNERLKPGAPQPFCGRDSFPGYRYCEGHVPVMYGTKPAA